MDGSLSVGCTLAERDEAAFRVLVERHAGAVAVQGRQAAEDATQETFVVELALAPEPAPAGAAQDSK